MNRETISDTSQEGERGWGLGGTVREGKKPLFSIILQNSSNFLALFLFLVLRIKSVDLKKSPQ